MPVRIWRYIERYAPVNGFCRLKMRRGRYGYRFVIRFIIRFIVHVYKPDSAAYTVSVGAFGVVALGDILYNYVLARR